MKKLILAAITGTCAISVFAQGSVEFNNNSSTLRTRVYAPLASNPTFSQIGNGPIDAPAGTTGWTGFVFIGANGTGGQYGGATTLTTLLAATGLNDPESSLQPGTPTTTFRTGVAGGFIAFSQTVSFANIPSDYAGGVTMMMVAWDDSSTLYPTWAAASQAWLAGEIAAGECNPFNVTSALGGTGAPPLLPTNSLESFNLYYKQVPEPSTFALAGLGAAALVITRWRK